MADSDGLDELMRSETVGIVRETLEFMLYECSLDEAPQAEDVRRWQAVLAARGGRFTALAQLCTEWLAEETA